MRRAVLILAITNFILVVVSLTLAFKVIGRPRFAPTQVDYVMFDTKTAQACSSHPNPRVFDPLYKGIAELAKEEGIKQTGKNEVLTDSKLNDLPFCSELR